MKSSLRQLDIREMLIQKVWFVENFVDGILNQWALWNACFVSDLFFVTSGIKDETKILYRSAHQWKKIGPWVLSSFGNPPDFMIQWNPADFMKFGGFHEIWRISWQGVLQCISVLVQMKNTAFRGMPWNPADFHTKYFGSDEKIQLSVVDHTVYLYWFWRIKQKSSIHEIWQISWWNSADFMAVKSGGFHKIRQISCQGLWFWWKLQLSVVDHTVYLYWFWRIKQKSSIHEIWQISWWNLADFMMKSGGFHPWNQADFMADLEKCKLFL